ncbi:hypothetical protein I6A84_14595 [Frankia sp. CNm7]|uniref:Uncharacterized protein n=1 Tax=Frankia nepalensis TaxID=1836974 RepID=A0A937RAJ2_9ACTN|nr:hypothetical protein [Frankia nepalensis]MBL7501592.1 hypothetical protein [Frankia nepalensis]MBL7515793.1 hypothetical protein [Frankia nepalensis]MBL7519298.1 hypothetical protein [Frankia nepalensis]MBL7626752.1 hypothetical protein [Frankia nepalensis]
MSRFGDSSRPDGPAPDGSPWDQVGSARDPDTPDGPLARLGRAAADAAWRFLGNALGRLGLRRPGLLRSGFLRSGHRRGLAAAGAFLLLAAAGGAVWLVGAGGAGPAGGGCDEPGVLCSEALRIAAQADPDRAVAGPDGSAPAPEVLGQSYLTTRPADQVPPPPGGRDDCSGRAAWAASIGAVPADISPLRLDISARRDQPVRVLGFAARVDILAPAPTRANLLTCSATTSQDDRQWATPTRNLPRARALADAGAVTVDLERRTSGLIELPTDAVPRPPGSSAVEIEPGRTASILVATMTATCDCRWRLEVVLLVDGEHQVVTVGPDGVREGPAAANPGQPSFETAASWLGTSLLYTDGQWRPAGALGVARPPCPLPRAGEIAAVLGDAPGGEPVQADVVEQSGLTQAGLRIDEVSCSWQASPYAWELGSLAVSRFDLPNAAAAHTQYELLRAPVGPPTPSGCVSGTPTAASAPVAVPGLGDEATRSASQLVARAGSRVVVVTLCVAAPATAPASQPAASQPAASGPTVSTPAPPVPLAGDPEALARTARAVLAG